MSNRKLYLKFGSHLDVQKNVKSIWGNCAPIRFLTLTSTSLGLEVNHMIYGPLRSEKEEANKKKKELTV